MTILLIIFHLAAVFAVTAARRRGILHFPVSMLPVVILLPFWGTAFALVAEAHMRGGEKADEEPAQGRFGITDEVYRSIRMDKDDMSGVLPIGDVLETGTPVRRRRLLLSVLHEGPAPFVKPLRTAGVNDDTEVVHYAVTALSELRSEFEQRIEEMEESYRRHPSSPEVMRQYADLDEEYLGSRIPDSRERAERSAHCRRMLEKLIYYTSWQQNGRNSRETSGSRLEATRLRELHRDKTLLIRRLGKICLLQGDAGAAEEAGHMLLEENPHCEEGYMLILRAKAAAHDGRGIADVIAAVRQSGIYLSPAAREEIRFWSA